MKIIEVQFDGHVKLPNNGRVTNVLRTTRENELGSPVLVDSLTEEMNGILAVKTVENSDGKGKTVFRKLYPWMSISEVIYEPEAKK